MIVFENVGFSYGKKQILHDLSFTVPNGGILAVMGASGSGKSTLLNLAAGLRKPDTGRVTRSSDAISYVFQEPRLFPWMSVYENVSAVLSDKSDAKERIFGILASVGLESSANALPASLSGGMKTRASIARALAADGGIVLLDEPFAALDDELRARISRLLGDWIRQNNKTALLVTHQSEDADALGAGILTLTR